MIISRYLRKEVFLTTIAVTVVLLLIFLSNQLVRYLSYAAAGKIAAGFVMQMLGFEVPYLLALLLPLGFYLGIILAYGRLYADSEMPVLNACGFSVWNLLRITAGVALGISALVSVLMLWVNPLLADQKGKGIANDTILTTLRAGRFQVINDGRTVIYVERISRDRAQANNLFIASEPKVIVPGNNSWTVVSAAHAFQEKDAKQDGAFIVATDGFRYEGTPGDNAYKIMQFKKYALKLPSAPVHSAHQEQEAIPTLTLWHQLPDANSAAELEWRLSMPISVWMLMVLAIPLCRVRPRQGRYAALIPAVLLYVIYVNVLFMARNWVEFSQVPAMLGMWWVHSIVFLVGFILLGWQTGLFSTFLARFSRKPFHE